MANDVVIEGSGGTAKLRNPWLVLLFSVLTLGVYACFWWYFVNREMADLGRTRGSAELGDSPGLSVVAYTLGSLVYIPLIITIARTNRRAQRAQAMTVGKSLNGWIAGLLWVFTLTFGGMVYLQFELNKVWRAPGMRPTDQHGAATGDLERGLKLEQLLASGALTQAEHEVEKRRLGL